MGNIFGRFGGEQYLSQCLDNDGDGAYDTDRPRRRKQKYPRRPVLKTFETIDAGPVVFDPADVKSIRPAGGTWEGLASWVNFGGVTEVALKGTVPEVATMISEALKA